MTYRENIYANGVQAHQRGQSSAWVAAMAAEYLTGEYEKEVVSAFAFDCSVSPSTVYEWAQGYALYKWIRAEFTDVRKLSELRTVRRGLTLSHFIKMAALWHKYELGIWEVWAQLETAWSEGVSVRSMVTNCERELKTNGEEEAEPLIWARAILPRLTKLAGTDYDTDARVTAWAAEGLRLLAEVWGLE